ncbi:hypothetical protein [Cronobacter sakazakii]|uniref:hypothetical protein n=1 Tax=Cronobacter sakazakii TaxID=28141 RepID=UPI003D168557
MSFTDTSSAKKYASIAETAAAQAKLYANKLELAPNYAEQAAASATAAAASAQVAVNAEGVVNNLVVSASESATSAAGSAALAGNAAAAAVGQCVRVVEGELIDPLPESSTRANSFLVFDSTGNATVLSKDDVAILDSEGKVPVSMIPAIAITQPFVVSSQAAMLALDAQVGDVAKRTDKGFSFILSAEPASTLSNWVQLNDDVLAQLGLSSGAAQVGALDDAGGSTTVQGALNLKATTASVTSTDSANRAWTNENFADSTYKKLQTGNFATGFTITNQFQVVLFPTDGFWYRYLGTIPGGGLTLSAGSSPDSNWENINKQQKVSLRKINELSTNSIAGYICVDIDLPISVKDTDGQGVHVGTGVTICNESYNQNAIKTLKTQSAFNIFGSSASFLGLYGKGSADITSSATSEFITSRGAWSAGQIISDVLIENVTAESFTTGIDVMNARSWRIRNVKFKGMSYGGSGLGYAGGYGILTQANVDGLDIDGVYHTLVFGKDRHCIYASETSPVSGVLNGWQNLSIKNVICDWRANTESNVDPTNGILFAMSPIHIRTGRGMSIDGVVVMGLAGAAIDLENQNGVIENVSISNVVARDLKSYANGNIVDTGAIRIGYLQYTNRFKNISIRSCDLKIGTGTGRTTQNSKGIYGFHIDNLRIQDCALEVDGGNAIHIEDSTDVVITGVADRINDTTSPDQMIKLVNVTGGFISGVSSNRPISASGSAAQRIYTLTGCTDIRCDFRRSVSFTITAGSVGSIDDPWSLLALVPSVSGSTVTVSMQTHVVQDAVKYATIECDTVSTAAFVKSGVGSKTVAVTAVNTTTGAPLAMSSVTARIEIHIAY